MTTRAGLLESGIHNFVISALLRFQDIRRLAQTACLQSSRFKVRSIEGLRRAFSRMKTLNPRRFRSRDRKMAYSQAFLASWKSPESPHASTADRVANFDRRWVQNVNAHSRGVLGSGRPNSCNCRIAAVLSLGSVIASIKSGTSSSFI